MFATVSTAAMVIRGPFSPSLMRGYTGWRNHMTFSESGSGMVLTSLLYGVSERRHEDRRTRTSSGDPGVTSCPKISVANEIKYDLLSATFIYRRSHGIHIPDIAILTTSMQSYAAFPHWPWNPQILSECTGTISPRSIRFITSG